MDTIQAIGNMVPDDGSLHSDGIQNATEDDYIWTTNGVDDVAILKSL